MIRLDPEREKELIDLPPKRILGAGGGGKGGGGGGASTQTDPDTLLSESYVKFIHLICEGEIQGLVNGLASVYLNNTPLIGGSGTISASIAMDSEIGNTKLTCTVQDLNQLDGIAVGQTVVGVSVPSGSTVVRIDNGTAGVYGVILSNAAVSTVSNTAVEFTTNTGSNFLDFVMMYRYGTDAQDPIPGFDSVETEISVPSTPLYSGIPLSATITDLSANAAALSIYTPTMETQVISGSNVHITGASCSYHVQAKGSTTSFSTVYTDSITGKCSSPFVRSFRIDLTPLGPGPWTIQVIRDTPDSVDQNTVNTIYWYSLFSIKDILLTYPNSVIFAGQFDSKQFSSIPTVAYHLKLLKIQIPTNYDPIARTYATSGPGTTGGIWDGTFVTAWSDNPAWCFYDLLTSSRYGLGSYFGSSAIDKYTLYTIGQYCDGLVPDGYGGMEPRFTCNAFIQNRDDAFRVVANMAAVFRGIVFWTGGQIELYQDSPADPQVTFTNANVVDGMFTYSGTALKSRHTTCIVGWNDPENFSQLNYEYVEDTPAVRLWGVRELDITAFGCASRGQARRAGRWALYSEQNDTETCMWEAGWDGAPLYPGLVVNVVDQYKAGARMGGRIVSCNTTTIIFDAAITFAVGTTYSCYFTNTSGALQVQALVNPATSVPVSTATLTFSAAISVGNVPSAGSVFAVSASNLVPQQFRILSVEETGRNTFKIGGLQYNPNKYAYVETGAPFSSPPTSSLTSYNNGGYCQPPTNLNITDQFAVVGETLQRTITVSWTPSTDTLIKDYTVEYSFQNGNYIPVGTTSAPTLDFNVLIPADYTIRVCANNSLGIASIWVYDVHTLASQTLSNSGITGLELTGQGNNLNFTGDTPRFDWRYNSPSTGGSLAGTAGNPDIVGYDIRLYDTRTTPSTFLREDFSTDETYSYTYEDNFRDTGGNPTRQIEIQVAGQDSSGHYSNAAKLDVVNPAPFVGSAPPIIDTTQIRVSSKAGFVSVSYTAPNDPDFAGMLIFVSRNPAFSLSDITGVGSVPLASAMVPYNDAANTGMLAYQGADTTINLPLAATVPYYFIFAPYDQFGNSGLNYYGPMNLSLVLAFDTTPPNPITGLTLTTSTAKQTDGTVVTVVTASWTANSEPDLMSYGWSIRRVSGSPTYAGANVTGYTSSQIYTPTYGSLNARTASGGFIAPQTSWIVLPGVNYEINVNASDTSGNASAWLALTTANEITALADTTPPAIPSGVSSAVAFRLVTVNWANPTDSDFAQVNLWANTVNNFSTATQIAATGATSYQIQYPLTGNFTGVTYYYWLTSQDTTGNISLPSTVSSVTLGGILAPTGLTLGSTVTLDANGNQVINLTVSFTNPNSIGEQQTSDYQIGVSSSSYSLASGSLGAGVTSIVLPAVGNSTLWVRVRITDANGGFSAWTASSVTTVKDTTAPGVPTGLAAYSAIKSIFLSWTNPTDLDLAQIQVFRNTTNTIPGSPYVVTGRDTSLVDSNVVQGTTYYYWLKSVDSSGNVSAATSSANTTPGLVATSDIGSFAVGLTQQYSATVALQGIGWTDNSPSAGYIAWSTGTLVFQGAAYTITAGNTNNPYVYWDLASPTVFATSATNPTLTDNQFMIATNANSAGVHDLAWTALANALIGTAYIQNLAVTAAKILSLNVDKLTSGSIIAQTISMAPSGAVNAALYSSNYNGTVNGNNAVTAAGTSGFWIDSSGYAEFNNVTLRASLVAGSIAIGSGANSFHVDSSGNLWMGATSAATAPFQITASGNITIGYPTAKLTFNASTSVLSVSGYIAVTGAAADVNSGSTTISGGLITASSITATQLAATITTTKELVIDVGGKIHSIGATSLTAGAGFWMDTVSGNGDFRFGDPSGQYIKWDSSTSTLSLVGGINISALTTLVTPNVYVDGSGLIQGVSSGGGTAVKNSLISISSGGTLAGAGGGTVTIGGLGYTGALNATYGAVFGTNLSGGPFATPSGTGMFIDSTHMGYYTGSTWTTYLDSSGNFYLGGASGALVWNGSTLTIQGNASFSGTVNIGSGVNQFQSSSGSGTIFGATSGVHEIIDVHSGVLSHTFYNGSGQYVASMYVNTSYGIGAYGNLTIDGANITTGGSASFNGSVSAVAGFSGGSSSQFHVDGSGNVTTLSGATYTFNSGSTLIVASGAVLKMGTSGAAAPSTSLSSTVSACYGGTGVYLGTPSGWFTLQDSGGTTRKVPYYT